MIATGISAISFYTPHRYIGLETLAEHHGIDPEKFSKGIGQEKIAMPGHDEDIVTMAAEAAKPIIDRYGADGIDTVLFATETGIDQSKSAGIYVHQLLGLPANCRNVELKQACYSATPALQMACSYVARKPDRKVLVIASDVARYDLDSSGEATQGAGAVAMLVTANPTVLEIGANSGVFTEDIMDFWRPNDRRTPLFDGKYSTLRYLNAMTEAWKDYQANGGHAYDTFSHFCYHLPFSRMGEKAHGRLAKANKTPIDMDKALSGMAYNRVVGNSYTASIYLSLMSTLENTEGDLTGNMIGLFSYGSGATGEFFDAKVVEGYADHLFTKRHQDILSERVSVSYDEYVALWNAPNVVDGTSEPLAEEARGRYRLARIDENKRIYIDQHA
ncbi:hydroxymethylglutaryl-CoA synthase [Cognatishimia activa]|uniref:Polyketide biosynthesis 3-hydroxy-3-methylglutaryl-ACP synthase PksG n=1 Tax=Cognatishimia activa TaxID=1715691 RepID=A0A0P1IRY0_9RHOB|nr:hydroxymethylglutaryl-CoA synthase [Cognatishimia activa]CUI60591.1 Polyketide biosynthesis 3-hydroxy-3-methylglutaryl-ACP synthase PksG [Cognatishimia activa]CUK26271.1 Polyketide biosynthesis 3-hydroxy-3-methylglutaryl-ACP synthase PksG [Cognatishimia activa]